jgi:dTDP-4-dehydrorhamnose 3,5-epimerase
MEVWNLSVESPLEIEGVIRRELAVHSDSRGDLAEFFRADWKSRLEPVQWHFVRTQANVLRGVHAHARHLDYLILLEGRMLVGLRDLRLTSPTYGRQTLFELHEKNPEALEIPPGVAHGFYSATPTLHVCGVSHHWHPDDELGCHWDDPALQIAWPRMNPIISVRDSGLGTMRDLEAGLLTRQSELCALA